MSWRVAQSLLALRIELNAHAPDRNRASDGTIGNPEHSARLSDHNPDAYGVVAAMDLTHDPANGADMSLLAEWLRTHPGALPLKYLIFRRRLASAKTGWKWVVYVGPNPHDSHLHISVAGNYDRISQFIIQAALQVVAEETDEMTPEQYELLKYVSKQNRAIADLIILLDKRRAAQIAAVAAASNVNIEIEMDEVSVALARLHTLLADAPALPALPGKGT